MNSEDTTLTRRIIPIFLTSLSLGLIFNWFFVDHVPGISVLIYTILVLSGTFYLTSGFRHKLNPSVYWLLPPLLFFSFMVFIRANPFLAFINICITIYLLLLFAQLAYNPGKHLRQYNSFYYLTPFLRLPFRILGSFFSTLQKLLTTRVSKESKSSYIPVIRGILLTLPIFFLFLLLLSSADLVFQQFLSSLIDLHISPEAVFRTLLTGFISSLFFGTYALLFLPSSQTKDYAPIFEGMGFKIGSIESSIILGSVASLFFVFVAVQLAYFFGGSHQVLSSNFTYAEYARKGFFELIAVAALSLVMLTSIKKRGVFPSVKQSIVFKALSSLICVEVAAIMLSAHMRLNLYENTYGFTTLRLWSHLFIVWLAYGFGQLLYHILKDKNNSSFAFHMLMSILCFFAIMNVINPDQFIARRNTQRFYETGKIDLNYLSSLSQDAVPEIAGLLKHDNQDLQKGVASVLYSMRIVNDLDEGSWQATNIGRSRADKVFKQNADSIDAGREYYDYRAFGSNN